MLKLPGTRLISARNLGLVTLSALLQVAIFPIAGTQQGWTAWLSWFALTPLLLALYLPDGRGERLGLLRSAVAGYVCGILWYAGNCYWIYQTMYLYGGLPKPVAAVILILFSLYLGLYHALFAVLVALMRSRRRSVGFALFLCPVFWVAVELARSRVTGFPWDLLGYSQVDNQLLIRLAPLGGVMAIGFVLAAFNALFAWCILARGRAQAVTAALSLVLVCLLQLSAGRLQPSGFIPEGKALLLQENLAVGNSDREVRPMPLDEELHTFSSLTLHASGPDLGDAPTIVVWPEAPSHLQSDDRFFLQTMADLAHATHAPLIVGSLGVDRSPVPERGYFLYDSASLFDAGGSYQGRYDKIHLVPWGEYVPFKKLFAFAGKLTEGVGDMDRGRERTVFSAAGHLYGIFICYESIFDDEVRHFVRNGAQVLVNISDDGWYGDTGAPWQHLNMARMRAIENHRWLLRDTNTGVTCVIDPYGRIVAQAPRHIRGAFSFPFAFQPSSDITFYTRHGDWLAWLCCAVTLLALAPALRRSFV